MRAPRLEVHSAKKFREIGEQVKANPHLNIANNDIFHAGILEILSQTTNRDAVATSARYISYVDVVRPRFYRYAIVAPLVNEVLQNNIAAIHRICFLVP
jgi:hypothetical protein